MFDIIKDIWKNPGAAYSPIREWEWGEHPIGEELVRELDLMHKSGIDAVLVRSRAEEGDEYFAALEEVLEAAKKRFMLVSISPRTDSMHPAQVIRARKMNEQTTDGGRTLFCVYLAFENGALVDVRSDAAEGYDGYDLVLCGAQDGSPDLLDRAAAAELISSTYEKYYSRFSSYFGQTLIGFYTDACTSPDREVPYSTSMIEDFFECGGELKHLAALFFETKEKKLRREAEYIYSQAKRRLIGRSYYAPLADWCRAHGVALMGLSHDGALEWAEYFTFSGQAVGEPDNDCAVRVKAAADAARHIGQARSLCEVNTDGVTPDGMKRRLDMCFASGCSMAVLRGDGCDGLPRGERRMIADYIKRMAWLGAVGSNEPRAAVLCSDDYIPVRPVTPLCEHGYSVNYISIKDLMSRARVDGGTLRIDRYTYDTLLVDGRLRMNADIVRKIGEFAVNGGNMYRGSDFLGFMKKHVRLSSHIDGDGSDKIRLLSYRKSGSPFFLLMNCSDGRISGSLITDHSARAEIFDPFSGKTFPIKASLRDDGFAYPFSLGAREVRVIGMDPSALPLLGDPEKRTLCEIVSLSPDRMSFDFTPEIGRHATLSLDSLDVTADVRVNGEDAGRLVFKPFEADVTDHLRCGVNLIDLISSGEIGGCTVRIYDRPNADGSAAGENSELWDVYDSDRVPTGRTHRRGEPMPTGDFHLVVHVWVRNGEGEYLLTKRAPDKTFPLSWECTGGSAIAGEDSLTAALREVREETGLRLSPENGEIVIRAVGDRYFGDVWLFREEFDLAAVRLQTGETVGKRKATACEIKELIASGEFAPYDYLAELFGRE